MPCATPLSGWWGAAGVTLALGLAIALGLAGSGGAAPPSSARLANSLSTFASTNGTSFPNGCDSTPVVLQFSTVTTGGTAPYSYAWSFGDGQNGTGAAPAHAYEILGGYHVTVETTDANGSHAWTNFSVSVAFAPCPAHHPPAWDPVAAVVIAALIAGAVVGIALWIRTRPRPKA